MLVGGPPECWSQDWGLGCGVRPDSFKCQTLGCQHWFECYCLSLLSCGWVELGCTCRAPATWGSGCWLRAQNCSCQPLMWGRALHSSCAPHDGLWVPFASFLCPHWLSAAPPNSESSGCVINVLFTAPSRSLMKMLNKAWSQCTLDAPQSSVFCHLSVCLVYSPSSWSQPMGVLWRSPIWINFSSKTIKNTMPVSSLSSRWVICCACPQPGACSLSLALTSPEASAVLLWSYREGGCSLPGFWGLDFALGRRPWGGSLPDILCTFHKGARLCTGPLCCAVTL